MKSLDAQRDLIASEMSELCGFAYKTGWNNALEAAGNMAGESVLIFHMKANAAVTQLYGAHGFSSSVSRETIEVVPKIFHDQQKAREGLLLGLLEECKTSIGNYADFGLSDENANFYEKLQAALQRKSE